MTTSTLTKQQYKSFGPFGIGGYAKGAALWAHVRFDDSCGNGHNTFAITGSVREPHRRDIVAGGCLHDEIAAAVPELAPLIKWHLCSTDGPLHYIQNTLYQAGDKDCWGRRKGEPSAFEYGVQFNGVRVTHRLTSKFWDFLQARAGTGEFTVSGFTHQTDPKTYGTHYTLTGFGERWHECPFRDLTAAEEFCESMNTCRVEFVKVPTAWSEGKERDLDAARRSAIWPKATDEELTAPDLKERLEARLPKLLEEFRAAVESLGFVW